MSKPTLTFTGDGAEIAAVLGRLSASVAKGTTLPVLSCYALEVDDGRLIARATDLDRQHSAVLPVKLETGKDGAGACAAAGLLSGLLARCNGDGARVVLDGDGTLTISAGERRGSLRTLPLAEFPATYREPASWHPVETAPLIAAIRNTAFCVSHDTTRYVLNGLLLSEDGCAVATDGRRLAKLQYTKGEPAPPLAGAIVPTAALGPIADLLERCERVEVGGDESGIAWRAADETFFTKRIEGHYPNYAQVIPNYQDPIRVTVDRAAMVKALAWAKLYRLSKDQSVRLSAEGDRLTVRIASPDIGEAEESLPILRPGRRSVQIALNLQYLTDAVTREGGDQFTMALQDDLSPVLVLDESNPDYLGVLMPMRING